MSPFLDNCTFLVISACVITLISGTEKNYIEDIAPDFYEECPCLQPMPGGNSLGDYKTGTLAECWGACFNNSHCRSFSYSVRIVWVCDTVSYRRMSEKISKKNLKKLHIGTKCFSHNRGVFNVQDLNPEQIQNLITMKGIKKSKELLRFEKKVLWKQHWRLRETKPNL